MGRRIELPQLPAGQPQEQLQALYSYLYQMADALNNNLAEIGNGDFTDDEMVVVRQITGQTETGNNSAGMAEAETLKSLIIKTAQLIKSEIDQYNLKLIGTYEADGKLGRYVRKTKLDVDVTPTGIQQNYSFQEIIQGLKTYEINAKNYIKTGLLRTEGGLPVYGVAIGKDVVTFAEDGTETYNDGNKVAELTADELSFWQGGNKVAGYTGTAIKFYYGGTEKMRIDSGGITVSGPFDLNSTNFRIDSANKKVKAGDFAYDSNGLSIDKDITKNGTTFKTHFVVTKDSAFTPAANEYYSGVVYNGDIKSVTIGSNVQYKFDGTMKFIACKGSTTIMELLILPSEGSGSVMIYEKNGKTVYIGEQNNPIAGMYINSIDARPQGYIQTTRVGAYGTPFTYGYFDTVNYATLTQNSSREIKHDIRDMEAPGEKLDRLRPVTFVYDDDPEERTRQGLIYEEANEAMPEICTGNEGAKAINYVELIPVLLKEIQELRARVKALEERGGETDVRSTGD